jgi:ATP-dependent DNA helicase RecG
MPAPGAPSLDLEPALRPLRFAARKGFANLGVVKNLEAAVRAGLDRAKAEAEGALPSALQQFEATLEGLDALPEAEKRARIEALLALAGTNPAPADAAPPARPRAAGTAAPQPRAEPPSESPAASEPRRRGASKKLISAAPRVAEEAASTKRVAMTEASLGTPLSNVTGVGPKTAERLAKRGIRTVQDALFLLPRDYEDRSRPRPIAEARPGERVTVEGEVLVSAVRFAGRGRRIFEVALTDGTGRINLKFFRFKKAHHEALYARGARVRVTGPVTKFGAQKQMVHPEGKPADAVEATRGWVPVYPQVEGVPGATLRGIVQKLATACGHRIEDPMPGDILTRHGHPELARAVVRAHHPSDGADREVLEHMRARLVFDELLYGQLAMAMVRRRRGDDVGVVHAGAADFDALARSLFPFELTPAQRRAMAEIAADLESPRPMNRLLQGDVGSGKTAVALLAAALAHRAGRQTAILAPTEILAEQHAGNARRTLEPHGLRTALLTGSTTAKARAQLLRWLKQGQVDVLIGTHAILEPDVELKDLGLAVTDEQHRFGVQQRQALMSKRTGSTPDVLVMTATPIPRTLALTAYGDLQTSVIDELPPGRSPTETQVFVGPQAARAYDLVEAELDAGRQAYVIFPLVETSEVLDLEAATDAVHRIAERFSSHRVGLLHGRLRSDEKAEVMRAFAEGEVRVLVSTTVVEVGVDVPNATCIVIENAERFGLSQLHQLRGRVGRGQHRGRCLLLTEHDGVERLRVLEATSSGFEVAERDLQLRGPGEILGTRQSGVVELILADLVRDAEVLEAARSEAVRLIEGDPSLERHPSLRAELLRRFSERLTLAGVG